MLKLQNSQGGKAAPAENGKSAAFPFVLQFPNPLNPREIQVQVHPGLTIRDYFAARAMHTLMHDYDMATENFPAIARDAYRMADQMIRARAAHNDSAGNSSQFHEDHMSK